MSRFLEFASPAGDGAFVVQRAWGEEALARLPEYRIELLSEHGNLSPELLLGANATLAVELDGAQPPRCFNGYVTRFAVRGAVRTTAFRSGHGFAYEALLQPALALRSRTRDCRIFANTTLGELLQAQLQADGLQRVQARLGDTEFREMVVQYRESDVDFLTRLAEHAGLHYFFLHENGAHTLVLSDASPSPPTIPGLASFRVEAAQFPRAAITRFSLDTAVRAGHVALADFDADHPRAPLLAAHAAPAAHANADCGWFDHPGGTVSADWLARYARIRAEELACRQVVARGGGSERRIQVGHRTGLVDHPVAALQRDYLVTRHCFEAVNNLSPGEAGEGARFECAFEAIPAERPFRPARTTPRPVIAGTQSARVVAEAGDDRPAAPGLPTLARVKVAFTWERRGQVSCWARVAQPWAGRGHGFQNLPRRGEEVLVQFLDGDPDRPVVCGRVHNADHPPPYRLPSQAAVTGIKTLSLDAAGQGVPGRFNELRFDDRAGAEQVVLRAQADLHQQVLHDHLAAVGGESHTDILGDALLTCHGDRHLHTDGDRNESVGGSASLDAAQALHLRTRGGRIALAAGTDVHIAAGGTLVLEAGAGITLKVGGSFIDINPAGVFLVGPVVLHNAGGAALRGEGAAPLPVRRAQVPASGPGGGASLPEAPAVAPLAPAAQLSSFRVAAASGAPFCELCDDCPACIAPGPMP